MDQARATRTVNNPLKNRRNTEALFLIVKHTYNPDSDGRCFTLELYF